MLTSLVTSSILIPICIFGIFLTVNYMSWQKTEEKHKRELAEQKLETVKLMNEKIDMLVLIRWLSQTRKINLPVILRRDILDNLN